MEKFTLSGNIVDIVKRRIYPGAVAVEHGIIASITPLPEAPTGKYILPGFIDAHVHIESSMLIPSEFARLATIHGTVGTVSDPHEIANVLGIEGIRYMIRNGERVPFHFYFGASSCVPATAFETAGATITTEEIRQLFKEDKLKYLSEMMNYPGVLNKNPEVMEKIALARACGVPVDGHAPGLRGKEALAYASCGISTDHECFTLEEAVEKLEYGMRIIIREGSAAKNYNALHSLLAKAPEKVMLCSDDKHPNDLIQGHINQLVKRSIVDHGYDLMDVLRAASLNPVKHYGLDIGLLQNGDPADFIVVENLKEFIPLQTYVRGILVAERGKPLIASVPEKAINRFNIAPKHERDFACPGAMGTLRVIHALDGELITKELKVPAKVQNGLLVSDTTRDILKIAVVNRYCNAPVATAFIHGFGLKAGALASCIGHDSHNIIAVGTDDSDLCAAVNAVIEGKGGISVSNKGKTTLLPLPVAGIMSHRDAYEVAEQYSLLDSLAKELGTKLHAPFMTLSFMALLVIPELKLSDKGLFDAQRFRFIPNVAVN